MLIKTKEIPQADTFSNVIKTVIAVASGKTTYQEIAIAIGEKGLRQGRYYRKAGEILGLLDKGGINHAVLTSRGEEYLNAKGQNQKVIMVQSILNARIFQRVIPFLESKLPRGAKSDEFVDFLKGVTEPTTGETTLPRRASTIIGWLKAVGLVEVKQDQYILCKLPDEINAIPFVDESEPLLPHAFSLSEYQDMEIKASANARTISYIVDETKIERANASHRMLTNLVASRIRAVGAFPRYNSLVDLAAKISGKSFIFEMKSMGNTNVRAQIRRGISQLYEYRYLQNVPGAQLVLVVEQPLSRELGWMADYLINDRGIILVWDGDRKHLHCSQSHREILNFLVA
ncbi:MAG: hypothetical protein HZA50_13085 [Planctomycetes bacterium]|nr:hypothetical protein [Planctomycetota bacterium]